MDEATVEIGAAALDTTLPQWGTLARAFPLSFWAVGLVAIGWWARGKVDREFIDFLKRLTRNDDP